MQIIGIVVIIVIAILLSMLLGTYIFKIYELKKSRLEFIFKPVENFIYKLSGIDVTVNMNWKQYAVALLVFNLVMLLIAFFLLLIQSYLPYNPTGAKNMNPLLAFNTAVSFITNTDIQHYTGEKDISFANQLIVIIFPMFTSAGTGLASAAAVIRGIAGNGKEEGLGNFYVDLVRTIVRLLLPLSIIMTLILVWQGVPMTFAGKIDVKTIQGTTQSIIRGPVAALESIKHLGTNGGGFFSANSAHPFENPTPLTNVLEILAMMLIPSSLVYTYGLKVKNKKHAWVLYTSLMLIFVLLLAGGVFAESHPGFPYDKLQINTAAGNMEGKEVRFGTEQSAMFATVTTAFTTGSVDSMHDSYTPLGGAVPLSLMMLNTIFGGDGVGLINIITYAILTVFITGLMVGRTPEFLGKKVETKEMKYIALAILIHPLLILFATAISILLPAGRASINNPGFHGITQMLYEFTSAAANNGSEFAGFIGNTSFMNIMTGLVMLIGRYVSIFLLLAVAGSMAKKIPAQPTLGTFRTDSALFGLIFIAVIFIVGALTFFPALILGPISEFLKTL